jgi:acetate kinase
MKILVVNTGSSSIKYRLFEMENSSLLASGLVEKIGAELSIVGHKAYRSDGNIDSFKNEQPIADHKVGLELVAELLTDEKYGCIKDYSEITAIGHRIVHGGEKLLEPVFAAPEVIKEVENLIPLAPLHNSAHLMGIEVAYHVFPEAKQVLVMDTSFHHTMPEHAYMYAVPYEFYEKHQVRKYGFHGTSHKYVSNTLSAHLGKKIEDLNIISIHLGNGSSIAAVQKGKCIDTSMGLTPLAGILMGTRCGDIDPAVCYFIAKANNIDAEAVDNILNKKSGLLGICGSNDMREVEDKAMAGDSKAILAIEMLVYQIVKYIGAYFAALGGLDCILFTAGIGENSADIRERVMKKLGGFNITLNDEVNWENEGRLEKITKISGEDSKIGVFVVPTNEELQIAKDTENLILKN